MCDINQINFTTIEALSTESLIRILHNLSPVDRLHSERVCRKWRDASRRTWRDIQTLYIIHPKYANYESKRMRRNESHEFVRKGRNRLCILSDSRKIIRCLVSRVGRFIEQLTISFCDDNIAGIISIVSFYCQNLKLLSLHGKLKDSDEELLSMLFEGNQELHSFRWKGMKNVLELLPFRNWKSLRFPYAEEGNDGRIVSLIEHSEALEEFETNELTPRIGKALLNLRNFKSFYQDLPSDGPSPEMIFDVPLLNRLINLQFDIVESNGNYLQYCNMLQHCSQLKSLAINHFSLDGFSSTVLQAILALPTLETLRIGCAKMPDDMLIKLNKFKNLSFRDWSMNMDEGILKMIKASEFLENLDLGLTYVRPKFFKKLVRIMSNRHKYLNVMVSYATFDEASEICAGSKIRLVMYMQCFYHLPDYWRCHNIDQIMSLSSQFLSIHFS